MLRDHKRPLRFVAGRMLVKSGLCERLTIPQNGYHLRFYPSNLSEQLWVDRSWREPELTLIRAYLRPGDKVIDVGANVGDTAITASLKVGSKGKVWAVEAHPRTYGYLLGNIKLNGVSNIEALNAAATTEPGRLMFGNDRRDDIPPIWIVPVEMFLQHDGRNLAKKYQLFGGDLRCVRNWAPQIVRCASTEVVRDEDRCKWEPVEEQPRDVARRPADAGNDQATNDDEDDGLSVKRDATCSNERQDRNAIGADCDAAPGSEARGRSEYR